MQSYGIQTSPYFS